MTRKYFWQGVRAGITDGMYAPKTKRLQHLNYGTWNFLLRLIQVNAFFLCCHFSFQLQVRLLRSKLVLHFGSLFHLEFGKQQQKQHPASILTISQGSQRIVTKQNQQPTKQTNKQKTATGKRAEHLDLGLHNDYLKVIRQIYKYVLVTA